MIRFKRIGGEARGAAAIEFALIAPALILLIVGIAQLGILFMANAGLRNAVGEGARMATVYPRPTDDQIRARIAERRFGIDPARMTTPAISHGTVDGAPYADISVSYTLSLNFIFFSAPPITLTERRRVFQQPATS